MSTSHLGLTRSLRTSCAATLLALALPTTALAAQLPGEQIDRGDGIAGTSALADTFASSPQLSDDGRFAAFAYSSASGSKSGQVSPALRPVLGIYVRDIVANRTIQVVSTEGAYATQFQLSADGSKISIVTANKLLPSDTDLTSDVYIADVATKALTLATSTSEEAGGQITRDGTALLWTTPGTIKRTPLAGGPTTTLATGSYGIEAASADGTTVAYRLADDYSTIEVARQGASPVRIPAGAPESIVRVAISPDGKTAALLPFNQRDVRRLDVQTGTITPATWRVTGYPNGTSFSLSNDGWLLVTASTADYRKTSIGEVNLRTREVRALALDLDWQPSALTANGRFATTGYGHIYVAPTGTTPLPGTVDPPSPFAYLRFDYGCRSSSFLIPGIKASIAAAYGVPLSLLPAPTGASIVVRDRATNRITNQFAITSASATYPISPVSGNFRVDASVKLADGRTVSNTYYQDGYQRADCFPFGF
ncbi:MAG: hypothetical protein JHD16_04210 [Solirubrobacteraceae bacterium]|nr:hypothetical protein [Solirubrobacteraceae bacterium]